jgi:hypothetical protein
VLLSNNDGTWQNEEDLEPELMEKYWSDKGEIPTEMEVGEIAPLPKPSKLANYRPNYVESDQEDDLVRDKTWRPEPIIKRSNRKINQVNKWNWMHKTILLLMMISVGISHAEKQRREKVKLYQELNICQIEIETALWRQPSFCVIIKRVLERQTFRLDGADQSKCIYNLSSIQEY